MGNKQPTARNDIVEPIFCAVANGDLDAINTLVSRRASVVDDCNAQGETPLYFATTLLHKKTTSTTASVAVIKELLKLGADVNKLNPCNLMSPVMVAAEAGGDHADVIAALVAAKDVLLYQRNQEQMTALMLASMRGNVDAIKQLTTAMGGGSNVDDDVNAKGLNALMLAASSGHSDAVVALIKSAGADPNRRAPPHAKKMIPLMFAAINDRVEAIHTLVQHGADLELVNSDGDTPLLCAVEHRRVSSVRALLALGANPLVFRQSSENNTVFGPNAVVVAVHHDITGSMLAALFAAGADPNARFEDQQTALMVASAYNRIPAIKTLIAYAARINDSDDSGNTALRCAEHRRQTDAVKLLLQLGANTPTTTTTLTELMKAASEARANDVSEVLAGGTMAM